MCFVGGAIDSNSPAALGARSLGRGRGGVLYVYFIQKIVVEDYGKRSLSVGVAFEAV